ncbi:MAG: restriction endonuclease subunit S [Betaproteobacteria bacterium]|nr:restriction endonuclease subunit S [Betaproteobacteria bacterium]
MQYVPLSSVCEINPRFPKQSRPGAHTEVTFVPMSAVDEQFAEISIPESRRYVDVATGFTCFRNDDVLFAKITPCMENGKAAIARNLKNGLGFGSTEFHVLRTGPEVIPEWIYYYIRQPDFRKRAKRNFRGAAGQQRVPADFLAREVIPLPAVTQQRRIVDILSRAEGIIRLQHRAAEKAHEIIPALFLDMFGDPAMNPKGWALTTLGATIADFRYGTSVKSAKDGYPVLRIPNVIGDAIDLDDIKYVPLDNREFERLRLIEDDILFVRTNGNPDYVGRCAVVTLQQFKNTGFDPERFAFASYLIRGRPNPEIVNAGYLANYLRTAFGRRELLKRARTSAGQYNINIDGLSSVVVMLPPLQLQQTFTDRTNDVRGVLAQRDASRRNGEGLFQALLARSFA